MPRRPALLTQAEVARAIRGARQAGACRVSIRPDGTIDVDLSTERRRPEDAAGEEVKADFVL